MSHSTLRTWLQLTMATIAMLVTTQGLAWFEHHSNRIISKTVQQPTAFNTIHVDGSVTLKLRQSPTYSRHISISGLQSQLADLQLSISNHRLTIHAPTYDADKPQATVTVQVPSLAELKLNGDSNTAAYFRDQLAPLDVHLRGHSKLTLNGMVQLHKLRQKDHSQSQIAFTNSTTLTVTLYGHSHAYMAGRAQHLIARTFNHSRLDSQYLRADQSWLQANHNASIRISPLHESHAFANNQARIIYSTTPQHGTAYHADTATVLRTLPLAPKL